MVEKQKKPQKNTDAQEEFLRFWVHICLKKSGIKTDLIPAEKATSVFDSDPLLNFLEDNNDED